MIMNAHTKPISDLELISLRNGSFLGNNSTPESTTYIASCSLDGFVRIWDYKADPGVPVYESISSKKWVYNLYFDFSICALFISMEGKNCPQKILYFKPYQFNLIHAEEDFENLPEEPVLAPLSGKKSARTPGRLLSRKGQ
mmetsp:Transcript_40231/g.61402  ORF Transcript_40231/g.61402 Transcript_40231/m.61402 type:complete len:141 (+) Transcript_40231:205-627(+)